MQPCVEVSCPNCVSSLFFNSNLKSALAAAIFVQACTELTGIKYVTYLASDLELSFLPFLIISGSLIGMVLVHLYYRKTMLGLSIPFLAFMLLFVFFFAWQTAPHLPLHLHTHKLFCQHLHCFYSGDSSPAL